jgi:type I restriction enzyme R subunit
MYAILKGRTGRKLRTGQSKRILVDAAKPIKSKPCRWSTQKVPIEQFDFIVTEECHRSIYNLWKASPGYLMLFDRLNGHA